MGSPRVVNGEATGDNGTPARVLLVEDHELLAQSLAFTLRADGLRTERAPMHSVDAVIAAARDTPYDIVLLDLDLGESLGSGLELIKPLQETGARVVMLTAVTDTVRLAECIEAGAVGLVRKTASFEHLLSAVREAVSLGTLLSPGQRDELMAELRRQRHARAERLKPFLQLTHREQEVLRELMEGKNAEQIAQEWYVSITTVRSQIRSMLAKLHVHSQVAAVGLARRAGRPPADG